jgi:hypothetical protein
VNCTNADQETERDRVIRLLTDNAEKVWIPNQKFEDGLPVKLTVCDSAYQLSIISDFTWTEHYTGNYCSGFNMGRWSLNDENNVLKTFFQPFGSSEVFERNFEILELSEGYFSYQYAVQNTMIRIAMEKNED